LDSTDGLSELLARIRGDLEGREPALVFVFASAPHAIGSIAASLARSFPEATVLGSSSSGEFVASAAGKGAIVVVAVAGDFRVHARLARGLSVDAEQAVTNALAGAPEPDAAYPYRTAVLLLDALSGRGEEAALLTAAMLGPDVKLAGGAAADDLKMVETTVALGGDAASDAMVVAIIASQQPLGVGVSHGHSALSGPLRVTRAEGATLHELDGRPAWDVWRDETRQHAASIGVDVDSLSAADEGALLLRYEVGLSTGQGPLKIRAPLARREGSLQLACGVAEGASLRITESTPARQIQSAGEAARRAREGLGGGQVAGAVVFDCVCRALILGEHFAQAVGAIAHELGDVPIGGLETYGEIAMNEGDMSGFHNTTSVVLAFPSS
jgi:methyl-accepting chemotaxis protein